MDVDNVENADVGLGVVSRNGDEEGDFPDMRGKPWTRVEELGGVLELLHSPDDKDEEETESRAGKERDACE